MKTQRLKYYKNDFVRMDATRPRRQLSNVPADNTSPPL